MVLADLQLADFDYRSVKWLGKGHWKGVEPASQGVSINTYSSEMCLCVYSLLAV